MTTSTIPVVHHLRIDDKNNSTNDCIRNDSNKGNDKSNIMKGGGHRNSTDQCTKNTTTTTTAKTTRARARRVISTSEDSSTGSCRSSCSSHMMNDNDSNRVLDSNDDDDENDIGTTGVVVRANSFSTGSVTVPVLPVVIVEDVIECFVDSLPGLSPVNRTSGPACSKRHVSTRSCSIQHKVDHAGNNNNALFVVNDDDDDDVFNRRRSTGSSVPTKPFTIRHPSSSTTSSTTTSTTAPVTNSISFPEYDYNRSSNHHTDDYGFNSSSTSSQNHHHHHQKQKQQHSDSFFPIKRALSLGSAIPESCPMNDFTDDFPVVSSKIDSSNRHLQPHQQQHRHEYYFPAAQQQQQTQQHQHQQTSSPPHQSNLRSFQQLLAEQQQQQQQQQQHLYSNVATPIPLDTNDTNDSSATNPLLIDRIQDLELKLATLSKVLAMQKASAAPHPRQLQPSQANRRGQRHYGSTNNGIQYHDEYGSYYYPNNNEHEQRHYMNQLNSSRSSSSSTSSSEHHINDQNVPFDYHISDVNDDDINNNYYHNQNVRIGSTTSNNACKQHERNLSLLFLYDGNQHEYERSRQHGSGYDERMMLASMTVAERKWLGPRILKKIKKQHRVNNYNSVNQQKQCQLTNNDIKYSNYRSNREYNNDNRSGNDQIHSSFVSGDPHDYDEDETTFRTDDDYEEDQNSYNERFRCLRKMAADDVYEKQQQRQETSQFLDEIQQQRQKQQMPVESKKSMEDNDEDEFQDCYNHDINGRIQQQEPNKLQQQQQQPQHNNAGGDRTSMLTDLFIKPNVENETDKDRLVEVKLGKTALVNHHHDTYLNLVPPSKSDQVKNQLDRDSSTNSIEIVTDDKYNINKRSKLRGNSIVSAVESVTDIQYSNSASSVNNSGTSDDPNTIDRSKWFDFLNSFQESTSSVDDQMEEFIRVPGKVEYVMTFGFFVCVDSFLYMSTMLPIRFVWNCFLLMIRLLHYTGLITGATAAFQKRHLQFHRQHTYQIVQVIIIYTVYRFVLVPISIGKLYHWIRGQSMIKFYVIIAMVEIFDRLLSSLGQDCLDSMYWNTVSRPKSKRFITSILVVIVYVSIHTLILFVHVSTLNVAMNSADEALLSLLISGNFAEIKSTVFKKYNKAALFKITAADICERFKLALFLLLILLLNLCQGMNYKQKVEYIRICCIVCGAELLSDWIKHCFITKLNFLPSSVYPEYALVLAGDVTGFGHENINLDNSHAVVRRIGFAQIPLVVVMLRFIKEAYKYLPFDDVVVSSTTATPIIATTNIMSTVLYANGLLQYIWQSVTAGGVYFVGWLILLFIKLSLGSILQHISQSKLESSADLFLSYNDKTTTTASNNNTSTTTTLTGNAGHHHGSSSRTVKTSSKQHNKHKQN